MQRLSLLCVGSLKSGWARAACAEFVARLQHCVRLEIVEIPASKERDPGKQSTQESERLLAAMQKREGEVWVLDERGATMTSEHFAETLAAERDGGTAITFVIGGAYGFTDAVRDRADRLLSLSLMTLPHELCRILFLEQLYRAVEIGKGSEYHHG
jgi:23S rRNA (pseudouridine1915-N3)-methyltransferase